MLSRPAISQASKTQRLAAKGTTGGAKRKAQGASQLGQVPAKQSYLPQGSSSSDWQPPHNPREQRLQCRRGVARRMGSPQPPNKRSSFGRCLTNLCRDTASYPPLSQSCLLLSKSGQTEQCILHRPLVKIKASTVPWPRTSQRQRRQEWRQGRRWRVGLRRSLLMNMDPRRGLVPIQKSVRFSKVRCA